MNTKIKELLDFILSKKYGKADKIFENLLYERSNDLIEEKNIDISVSLMDEGNLDEGDLKRRAASGKSLAVRKKEAIRRKKGLSITTGKRKDPMRSRKAKLAARKAKASRKRGRIKAKRTNRRFK